MKWASDRWPADALFVLATMSLSPKCTWEQEPSTSGSCKSEGLCCSGKDSTCVVQKMRATGRQVPVGPDGRAHRGPDAYDAGLFDADLDEARFEDGAGTGNQSGANGSAEDPQAFEEELAPETPCYCDAACVGLRDCCGDYSETCESTDCKVGSWSPWSECSQHNGKCWHRTGHQVRFRSVETQPRNGGRRCPRLREKRKCVCKRERRRIHGNP